MRKYVFLSYRCDRTIFCFSLQNGNICYPLLYWTMEILPVWVEMDVLSLTSVSDRRWNLGNPGPWVYFSCGHYLCVKVSPYSQPLNHSSSNEKLSYFSWWPTPVVTIGPIAACYGLMLPRINHWVNTRTSFPSLFLCLHKIEFGIDSNQIAQMPGTAGCGFMTKIKCIT